MKLGTWQHRMEPVEFDPSGHGYRKDKYGLGKMEVGESLFHAGITNSSISPYTARLHKISKKRFLVLKHAKEGIPGTLVVRLTDRGHQDAS